MIIAGKERSNSIRNFKYKKKKKKKKEKPEGRWERGRAKVPGVNRR